MSDELENLADAGSFAPETDDLATPDPLAFPGYADAITAARSRAGSDESVVAGPARIGGREVELALFDFDFMGGSMGTVAGERLARAFERAADRGTPLVLRTSTGGARMQEGMAALVQMSKVVAARVDFAGSRLPYVAVLGHPTTGGVLASIGALADVCVAEAGATVGFAGPRVAQRAMGRPLQAGSHTAEAALEHGLVDEVVASGEAAAFVSRVLEILGTDDPSPVEPPPENGDGRDAWDAVAAARSAHASGEVLLEDMCDSLVFLRGDRSGSDDPALACCLARLHGRRAVVIAMDPSLAPGPAAYRKARRAVTVAVHLGIPLATIIDTRGADPSEESEAGGIAWEIAATFEALLTAPTPVLSVVTGEGGSGGALALAAGDRIVAYEDSIFSVIGPELAAEILWRDPARAPDSARALRLTAPDLKRLGIADAVLAGAPSPASLSRAIAYHLDDLPDPGTKAATARRKRWRALK